MKPTLKLMTDYSCYPLWWVDGYELGDIDPASLPLSDELIARLYAWADTYDAILNRDDPASSGFASVEDKRAFEQEGLSLWAKLREELGEEYEVRYFSEIQRKEITNPEEAE